MLGSWHDDCIHLVVVEQLQVLLGELGSTVVEIEKPIQRCSWHRQKTNCLKGRDDWLACSSKLFVIVLILLVPAFLEQGSV
jgi:hypothetical protein